MTISRDHLSDPREWIWQDAKDRAGKRPMNTQAITAERLNRWQFKLAAQDATPLALVGIGQGVHSGEIVLCIPENGPSDAEIAQLLRGVANQLSP